MGLMNQWKIISLEVDAQKAYEREEYEACKKMISDATYRMIHETDHSMPIKRELAQKLKVLEKKVDDKLLRLKYLRR